MPKAGASFRGVDDGGTLGVVLERMPLGWKD